MRPATSPITQAPVPSWERAARDGKAAPGGKIVRKQLIASVAVCLALGAAAPTHASPSTEEVLRIVRALQARVDALERKSRRDEAALSAARDEIATLRGRRVEPIKQPVPVSASKAEAIPYDRGASPFSGAYGALTGGLGFYYFPGGRDWTNNPSSGTMQPIRIGWSYLYDYEPWGTVSGRPSNLSGYTVGGAIGYNSVIGNVLVGAEARMRYDTSQHWAKDLFQPWVGINLPWQIGSGCCYQALSSVPVPVVPNFPIRNEERQFSRLVRPMFAEVSWRAGFVWNDFLLYGRAGAGLELFQNRVTRDRTGRVICENPIVTRTISQSFGFFSYRDDLVGCTSESPGPILTRNSFGYAPVLAVGVGMEKNFGKFFTRLEGNLLTHLPIVTKHIGGNLSVHYTTELNAAIGYRF